MAIIGNGDVERGGGEHRKNWEPLWVHSETRKWYAMMEEGREFHWSTGLAIAYTRAGHTIGTFSPSIKLRVPLYFANHLF